MLGVPFAKLLDGTYVWGPYTIVPARYSGTSTRYLIYRYARLAADHKFICRARTLEDAKQAIRDERNEGKEDHG